MNAQIQCPSTATDYVNASKNGKILNFNDLTDLPKKKKRSKPTRTTTAKNVFPIVPAKWVKAILLFPLFGFTMEAARKKRERGVWLEGKHWCKAPDNNYMYNPREIENWCGGSF